MSRTIVSKFGGSSCGNAEAYRRLGQYFSEQHLAGHKVVGVFSAMFAVTDRLLNAIQSARENDEDMVQRRRQQIWDLHSQTATELLLDKGNAEEAMDWIDHRLKQYFDATLQRVSEVGSATAYDRDCVAHLGERLSIKLIDAHCRELGLPSTLCESDELLVTTDESSNAEPLLDETQVKVDQNLKPLLEQGKIPMVSGYFGRNVDGKLMTLGRGGTDLTAAVMGYALNADEINLYKVEYTRTEDGWLKDWQPGWIGIVHDAEPTITIPEMSYDIAAELAHFGKKVLHPATVYPAVRKSIPIYVKNNYDHAHAGTKIMDGANIDLERPVISITSMSVDAYEQKYGVAIRVVHPSVDPASNKHENEDTPTLAQVQYAYQEFLRNAQKLQKQRVLENHADLFRLQLEDIGAKLENIMHLSASLDGQEMQRSAGHTAVGQDGSTIPTGVVSPGATHVAGDFTSSNLSFVTLVGPGIAKSHNLMRKLRLRLKRHGIPNSIPRNVRQSDDRICVVVDSAQCARAVNALHMEFVGRPNVHIGADQNREKLTGGNYFINLGDNYTPVYGKDYDKTNVAAF